LPSHFQRKNGKLNTEARIRIRRSDPPLPLKPSVEEEPGRFRIDEEIEPGKVRSYESPDLPCEGRYMLFVKSKDTVTLFPLTQKLIFKQLYTQNGGIDLETANKNTMLLMKNRKIKSPKKEETDKKSLSDSLEDLVNKYSDDGNESEIYGENTDKKIVQEEERKQDEQEFANMLRRTNYAQDGQKPGGEAIEVEKEFSSDESGNSYELD